MTLLMQLVILVAVLVELVMDLAVLVKRPKNSKSNSLYCRLMNLTSWRRIRTPLDLVVLVAVAAVVLVALVDLIHQAYFQILLLILTILLFLTQSTSGQDESEWHLSREIGASLDSPLLTALTKASRRFMICSIGIIGRMRFMALSSLSKQRSTLLLLA